MVFTRVHRQRLLAVVSLAAVVAVFFVPRIPQDPAYHNFVDARTLLGLPNFWNVISNVGYLMVGLYGLARLSRVQAQVVRPAYITFCVAVTLVAFGSFWYHYAPTTDSLVWDRLPMAAGFMALLSLVLFDAVGLSGHSIEHFVSSVAVLFALFAVLEMKAPEASRPLHGT